MEIELQYKQALASACTADIALVGGGAGGGKSFWAITEMLKGHAIPGFSGVIFRRTAPELTGGGSIWEEARPIFTAFGGEMREHRLDCRFPSGAIVEFRHLQYDKDKHAHQGKQYAVIIFEELGHFLESQFWYMLSRNRSSCGVRPYMRGTLNPDPDHFTRKMVDWWIDETGHAIPERIGVIRWFVRDSENSEPHWADSREELVERFGELANPLSFTFIAASLEDNQKLVEKDPAYRMKLLGLDKVERERLLGGNWNIRPAAGLYFKADYFNRITRPQLNPAEVIGTVRYWDLAATEVSPKSPDPDWTRGVLMHRLRNGRFVVGDGKYVRGRPEIVRRLLTRTAEQDGREIPIVIPQDPGQAGKDQVHNYANILSGFDVTFENVRKDKVTMAGPWSSACENGMVDIIDGDWVKGFIAEHEGFPDAGHDDWVDAAAGAHRRLTSYIPAGITPVTI